MELAGAKPQGWRELALCTPVTALAFNDRHVLIGTGGRLHVYLEATGECLHSHAAFEDEAVHGITTSTEDATLVVLYGVRQLCVVHMRTGPSTPGISRLLWRRMRCRILTALACEGHEGQLVRVGCDDNSVHTWHLNNHSDTLPAAPLHAVRCRERSVLYSMALRGPTGWLGAPSLVASGSAFRFVMVWDASMVHEASPGQTDVGVVVPGAKAREAEANRGAARPVLLHLRGHEGSVFGLAWSPRGDMLASASDDRRMLLWRPGLEGRPLADRQMHPCGDEAGTELRFEVGLRPLE